MRRDSKNFSTEKEVTPMKKKRTYRTVKVKQVDRVRLAEVWRGARLVVGLDVGKEEMVVSLMDQERVCVRASSGNIRRRRLKRWNYWRVLRSRRSRW